MSNSVGFLLGTGADMLLFLMMMIVQSDVLYGDRVDVGLFLVGTAANAKVWNKSFKAETSSPRSFQARERSLFDVDSLSRAAIAKEKNANAWALDGLLSQERFLVRTKG
jgi:hypothetical protein